MKLYFEKDGERCYPLSYFKELMKDKYYNKFVLYEAKRITKSDFFYCKWYEETGEKDFYSCGKYCGEYKPNNGVSGRCKHYGYTYEPTNKKITIYNKEAE
jgi:hypothetical protein